jgi:hypothetical protein
MSCWKTEGCLVLGQRRSTEWVWIMTSDTGMGSVIWHFADRHYIFWWPIVHEPPGIKPSFTIKQNARGVDFSSTHRLEAPFQRIHSECSVICGLLFIPRRFSCFQCKITHLPKFGAPKHVITAKCNRPCSSLPTACINCTFMYQLYLYQSILLHLLLKLVFDFSAKFSSASRETSP